MTNFVKNLGYAAAAMAMTAGMACAQTTLKADIPFAFRVGNKVMPAGTYSVARVASNGARIFNIQGSDDRVMSLALSQSTAAKEWRNDGQARLAFECAASCTLRQVWTGGAEPVYGLSGPKNPDVNTHIAVVVMRPDKGD
jgi:hypothetical protein